jgi:hypothetical protein
MLDACPEETDQVVLEPDLEWHTEDGKYGSTEWLAKNPPTAEPVKNVANGNGNRAEREASRSAKPNITQSPSPAPDNKGKRKAIEILSDSDDDDDTPRKTGHVNGTHGYQAPEARLPSTTVSTIPPPNPAPKSTGVIDLTLDSSDEEDDPPPRPTPVHRPSQSNGSHAGSSQGFQQPDVAERGLRVPPPQPQAHHNTINNDNHTVPHVAPHLAFSSPSGSGSSGFELPRLGSFPSASAGNGGMISGPSGMYGSSDVRRRSDEGYQQQPPEFRPSRTSFSFTGGSGGATLHESGSGPSRGALIGRLSRDEPPRSIPVAPRAYNAAEERGRYAGDHWEPGGVERARWEDDRSWERRDRDMDRYPDRDRDRDSTWERDRDRSRVVRDRYSGSGNTRQNDIYSKAYRDARETQSEWWDDINFD